MATKSSKGKASVRAAANRVKAASTRAANRVIPKSTKPVRPTIRTITYKSGNTLTKNTVTGETTRTRVAADGTRTTVPTKTTRVATPTVAAASTTRQPSISVPTSTEQPIGPGAMQYATGGGASMLPPTVGPVFSNNLAPTVQSRLGAPASAASVPPASAAPSAAAVPTAADNRQAEIDRIAAEAQKIQESFDKLKAEQESKLDGAVVSDEPIVNEEESALDSMSYDSPTTDALTLLQDEMDRLEDIYREDKRSIEADYKTQQTSQENKQAGEVGQTSVGLANAGGYLGFSGSGTGVMLSLAKGHRDELLALESERQNAIREARTASENRRFDLVREQAAEIARIDNEVYARKQDYFNNKLKLQNAEISREEKMKNDNIVFQAIQQGNKTPEQLFKAIGDQVGIEGINSFLEQIRPSRKEGDMFAFSNSDITSLLGAGLGQDDIDALNSTVNELGYTEEVRSALPSSVRAIADSIYRGKTGSGSGSTSGSSSMMVNGRKISSVTQQVIDGFTSMSALTPTMQQTVRDDLYELGFADDTPPDWFDPESVPREYQVAKQLTYNNDFSFALDSLQIPGQQSMLPGGNIDTQKTWENYVRAMLSGGEAEDSETSEIDAARAVIEQKTR